MEQQVKKINRERGYKKRQTGKSYFYSDIIKDASLGVDYLVALPRMAFYIEYSTRIYQTYRKYFAEEDIHVYSIDEVFIDITSYLKVYGLSAHDLAIKIVKEVLNDTGITATVGIGTNMYLAKVAMDIVAKHLPADKDGVRIAELDELSYRKRLWAHMPITDFWRVGRGYARRLEKYNLLTMGDIARFSLENDAILYKEFGINAELLIDHAWGYEPTRMEDIKAYEPENHSLSSGQVLMEAYSYDKARIIVKEMSEQLALDLMEKGLMTDSVGLYVGYDISEDLGKEVEEKADWYGRILAKPSSAAVRLERYTYSAKTISQALVQLYDHLVEPSRLIRRINLSANHVLPAYLAKEKKYVQQMDLFSNEEISNESEEKKRKAMRKDEAAQKAILNIKNKYGKNSVIKGTSLEEGATGLARNKQIGGHRE
ncbi:MAG: DNA methylase [Solobacterium sp.]|nr:DNA methylase [Solobacterium sp.]